MEHEHDFVDTSKWSSYMDAVSNNRSRTLQRLTGMDGQLDNLEHEIADMKAKDNMTTTPEPGGCRNGWRPYNGSCYFASREKQNWFDAATLCRIFGGYLVEISDSSENEFVQNLIDTSCVNTYKFCDRFLDISCSGRNANWMVQNCDYFCGFCERGQPAWIGAVSWERSGSWVWASGQNLTYTNWNDANFGDPEPNNADGGEPVCIMYPSNGKWNDVQAVNSSAKYVCESDFQ